MVESIEAELEPLEQLVAAATDRALAAREKAPHAAELREAQSAASENAPGSGAYSSRARTPFHLPRHRPLHLTLRPLVSTGMLVAKKEGGDEGDWDGDGGGGRGGEAYVAAPKDLSEIMPVKPDDLEAHER